MKAGETNPLAAALSALVGRCSFCGCSGDTCSMPEGGKCELVGELQSRCSAPACVRAYFQPMPRKGRRARREKLFAKGRAA